MRPQQNTNVCHSVPWKQESDNNNISRDICSITACYVHTQVGSGVSLGHKVSFSDHRRDDGQHQLFTTWTNWFTHQFEQITRASSEDAPRKWPWIESIVLQFRHIYQNVDKQCDSVVNGRQMSRGEPDAGMTRTRTHMFQQEGGEARVCAFERGERLSKQQTVAERQRSKRSICCLLVCDLLNWTHTLVDLLFDTYIWDSAHHQDKMAMKDTRGPEAARELKWTICLLLHVIICANALGMGRKELIYQTERNARQELERDKHMESV